MQVTEIKFEFCCSLLLVCYSKDLNKLWKGVIRKCGYLSSLHYFTIICSYCQMQVTCLLWSITWLPANWSYLELGWQTTKQHTIAVTMRSRNPDFRSTIVCEWCITNYVFTKNGYALKIGKKYLWVQNFPISVTNVLIVTQYLASDDISNRIIIMCHPSMTGRALIVCFHVVWEPTFAKVVALCYSGLRRF